MTKPAFRFEGGRISLDFIATIGARCGDLLPAPETLAAWVVAAGLTEWGLDVSDVELSEAHALRAALLGLVQATMDGADFRQDDVHDVNAAAAQSAPPQSLVLRAGDLICSDPRAAGGASGAPAELPPHAQTVRFPPPLYGSR